MKFDLTVVTSALWIYSWNRFMKLTNYNIEWVKWTARLVLNVPNERGSIMLQFKTPSRNLLRAASFYNDQKVN